VPGCLSHYATTL